MALHTSAVASPACCVAILLQLLLVLFALRPAAAAAAAAAAGALTVREEGKFGPLLMWALLGESLVGTPAQPTYHV